jgi:hypothetical protein
VACQTAKTLVSPINRIARNLEGKALQVSRDVEWAAPWDSFHDVRMPSQICILCDVGVRLGQSMLLLCVSSYHLALCVFVHPLSYYVFWKDS